MCDGSWIQDTIQEVGNLTSLVSKEIAWIRHEDFQAMTWNLNAEQADERDEAGCDILTLGINFLKRNPLLCRTVNSVLTSPN